MNGFCLITNLVFTFCPEVPNLCCYVLDSGNFHSLMKIDMKIDKPAISSIFIKGFDKIIKLFLHLLPTNIQVDPIYTYTIWYYNWENFLFSQSFVDSAVNSSSALFTVTLQPSSWSVTKTSKIWRRKCNYLFSRGIFWNEIFKF